MKFLKTLTILFFTISIISCSTDEDSDGISNKDSFEYKHENEDVKIVNWRAVKSENTIEVIGNSEKGESFSVRFNVYGNLSAATVITDEKDSDGFTKAYWAYEYFKSNYFNFELLGLDETNKRVSVKFSGDLYEDQYDIDSETNYVEGSFNVGYTEVTPQILGLEVSAVIDGDKWYSTSSTSSGGLSGSPRSYEHYSDNAYNLSYVIINNSFETGTFQFDSNTSYNKITFSRYDPNTDGFIGYETSGVFTISEHIQGFGINQIKGTFSLTAVNGNETIQITDGVINDIYSF